MRSDSLDQNGSADDLAETQLAVPAVSSSPPRQRSSSVHTLKCAHPQRVISCKSPSRSHSEATGRERGPEWDPSGSQLETNVEQRLASLQTSSSRRVPGGGQTLSAPPCGSRTAGLGRSCTLVYNTDEEVSHINSAVHTHSHTPGPSHKSRHLSPGPGERRNRLSQSLSPVLGRSRKQRTSPPPGEEPVTMATQLMDSSVELRRRTPSFDASTLLTHQPGESSVED